MAQAQTLQIPGIKGEFVVGMSWRHEDMVPKRRYLRELSMQVGRWGLVRRTSAGTIQVGLCEPIEGRSPNKLKSLAAVVADAKPNPWMGFYEISPGIYWYIAVRDGQEVIPQGDQVGTVDDLMHIRDLHLSYGGWTEVEGTLADLAEIVQSVQKHPRLSDLQARPWIAPLATVAGSVIVGAAGLTAWKHHEQTVELARQAALAKQRAAEAALHAQKPSIPQVLPWTLLPSASEVFAACGEAWHDQVLGQRGWALSAWTCQTQATGVAISTSWSNDGGVAQDAPGRLGIGAQTAADSGSRPVSFSAGDTRILDTESANREIWTLAQSYGMHLVITAQQSKPATSLPGATVGAPQVSADPWAKTEVNFDLPAAPFAFGLGSPFDSVPGLRVSSVNWDGKNWVLKGTLYAMHPTQPQAQVKP